MIYSEFAGLWLGWKQSLQPAGIPMTELMRLLSLYYACEVTAETQFPSPTEWARCMGHYHAVKTHFAGNLTGPQAQIEGYRAWKMWEDQNGALVAQLRDRAAP
ncbi:hypothetical protein [uncultured Tateyamaria sp.]|uniref:hypothetical protein n=1 Tax=uncultured Tateyamaria sp. TaxID=455651 RepID=UPI002628E980|nr:hypothetical protein [uncultured Tateyamaria sp.]